MECIVNWKSRPLATRTVCDSIGWANGPTDIIHLQDSIDQVAAAGAANQAPASAAASAFEALLAGGANGLQALLNMPDADDETMVQLAIALSLQDQVISWFGLFLFLKFNS